MRVRIFKKLFLSHFLAIVLVSGSIGTYFYSEAIQNLKRNLQMRLMNSASIISNVIDASDLQDIRTEADIEHPNYIEALRLLREMCQSNPDIAFLYIMRKSGDEVVFVVDSDESEDQALPGHVYPENLPALMAGFNAPSHDDQIYKDEWGAFMSGYAPLKKGGGDYLVGIDMRADEVNAKFRELQISGVISLILSFLLALVFSRYLAGHFNRSIELLVRKCTEVADGKYGHTIDAHTHDELDDLIRAFNHMSTKVETTMAEKRAVLDDLAKANAELERRVHERTGELQKTNEQLRGQIKATHEAQHAASRAESHLIQAHKLETIGSMASGIAHDFNNLMMGVVGNADLLLEHEALPPTARDYILQMKNAGLRTRDLTLNLLTYAGKNAIRFQSYDLNQLVHDIEPLLHGAISRDAVLEISPSVGISNVKIDHAQLRQVIMNLVINASEALPGGKGTIVIRTGHVEAAADFFNACYFHDDPREGTYVYLEVEDSGSGISDHDMPRIFDPFFTTKYEGRGLGLSVVAGVIRAHRGAIKVASDPSQGARITIFLPAIPDGEPVLQAPVEIPEDTGSASARTILVVDDEDMVRRVAIKMLETAGYKTLSADGGRQAIELFRQHENEIGLVLLDWTMPEFGGESVIQAIRAMKSSVPILVASGYLPDDILRRMAAFRVSAFLQKPYGINELLKIVGQFIPVK